jgi:hypothetical protein
MFSKTVLIVVAIALVLLFLHFGPPANWPCVGSLVPAAFGGRKASEREHYFPPVVTRCSTSDSCSA